jgi:hypothetical protein
VSKYPHSNSEAGQEEFVLTMLDEKRDGFYVEVGAYHSKLTSNTYLLEKEFGWKGVAFEILPECAAEYNKNRANPCIQTDATTFNYLEYFKSNNVPKRIDYLQLDIEPASNTLLALKQMPLDEYRFSVITFEHDLYFSPNNETVKLEQQSILRNYGYFCVRDNVKVFAPGYPPREFEDWWIDLRLVGNN